ncbi:MAG: proprotein convertase P-domain-containing protein, partial [Ferruginibacter sp.]
VRIELSTDGGLTYPVVISPGTANDGTEEIRVPNNTTSSARIRIAAVGNVFFDISNANFSIQTSPVPEFVFNTPAPVTTCGANSLSTTIRTASLKGFATAINLSATGNPAGTTVSFGANSLSPEGNTTVTLYNTNSLANGTYSITVRGVAGSVTKARVISFVINTIPAAPTLILPASNATGISTLPTFNWSAVAGAGFYKLDIAADNSFASLVQTVNNITTPPFTLTTPLMENSVYYWRVTSTNNCGTGSASATRIFKTGIPTCRTSLDVPKVISIVDTPTITSTITIPEVAGVTISDLNVVSLSGNHNYLNDLIVSLTSPQGTTVVLFNEICPGGTDENFNLTFDDEAAATINCSLTGTQTTKAQNLLSNFDGESSTGVWTLRIKDNYDQDGGNLTGWGLSFNNCALIATPISTSPWTELCSPMASTSLTSNLTGAAYQWQVNTGSGFVNIVNNANYSGTNAVTLQINNAPSTWNGYQYRSMVNGSYSTVFTLGFKSYWNGSVSTAWENAANWSCNRVPDANTDVIIDNGTVVVNSNAFCRSARVNPGASVTIHSSFKMTVVH